MSKNAVNDQNKTENKLTPVNVELFAREPVEEVSAQDPPPSQLHANALFNFVTELRWMLDSLKRRMVTARYCIEDIRSFKIPGLSMAAYPMRCFCDINMHNLSEHMGFYGSYGLAFTKEWGMRMGIQPLQYMNGDSPLCKDMAEVMGLALSQPDVRTEDGSEVSATYNMQKSYILHQLLYWKPYSGEIENRVKKEICDKCFADEFEWRFIPNLTDLGMKIIEPFPDEDVLISGTKEEVRKAKEMFKSGLRVYNETLEGNESASVRFTYDDLKYIILEKESDFTTFLQEIKSWDMDAAAHDSLLSKVIIWKKLEGDL